MSVTYVPTCVLQNNVEILSANECAARSNTLACSIKTNTRADFECVLEMNTRGQFGRLRFDVCSHIVNIRVAIGGCVWNTLADSRRICRF